MEAAAVCQMGARHSEYTKGKYKDYERLARLKLVASGRERDAHQIALMGLSQGADMYRPPETGEEQLP